MTEETYDERIRRIALGFIKEIPASFVIKMIDEGIGIEDVLDAGSPHLHNIPQFRTSLKSAGTIIAEAMESAKVEYEFTERHNIKAVSIFDNDYPILLQQIPDAPKVIYVLGRANLSPEYSLGVVGTRKPTQYGVHYCDKIIGEFKEREVIPTIVSGLAFGIDYTAHSSALKYEMPTIGVVAHGLHMIYPAQHRDFARKIIYSGGAVISEYPHGTTPYRGHFLERNRIIAGLTQGTFVVESPVRGGALNTANYAFQYNREVMALPGRAGDLNSEGCNNLIRRQKAQLVDSGLDIIRILDWKIQDTKVSHLTPHLFPALDGNARKFYDLLGMSKDPLSIDELFNRIATIPISALLSELANLEFEGIVLKHPGKRYTLA